MHRTRFERRARRSRSSLFARYSGVQKPTISTNQRRLGSSRGWSAKAGEKRGWGGGEDGVAGGERHERPAPADVARRLELEPPRPGEHGDDRAERPAIEERPPEEREGPGEVDAREVVAGASSYGADETAKRRVARHGAGVALERHAHGIRAREQSLGEGEV